MKTGANSPLLISELRESIPINPWGHTTPLTYPRVSFLLDCEVLDGGDHAISTTISHKHSIWYLINTFCYMNGWMHNGLREIPT